MYCDVVEQPVEHLVVGLAARVLRRSSSRHSSRKSSSALLAPRDADQLEALGQRALVGEVVERGQQLAVREVAGRAEDDQRRRRDRQPLEPLDERVLVGLARACRRPSAQLPAARSTACPPNWLRSAASTRCV